MRRRYTWRKMHDAPTDGRSIKVETSRGRVLLVQWRGGQWVQADAEQSNVDRLSGWLPAWKLTPDDDQFADGLMDSWLEFMAHGGWHLALSHVSDIGIGFVDRSGPSDPVAAKVALVQDSRGALVASCLDYVRRRRPMGGRIVVAVHSAIGGHEIMGRLAKEIGVRKETACMEYDHARQLLIEEFCRLRDGQVAYRHRVTLDALRGALLGRSDPADDYRMAAL